MKKLLVIGLIWPEPNSTAAGTRMLQLLNLFLANGFIITFVSTSTKNENSYPLEELGIITKKVLLNDGSFDSFIKTLDPNFVLFDRFIAEEQFGWRVIDTCPNAIRILDSEDLHFLRKARELALKKLEKVNLTITGNDIALRELASIYRCDLTLIISEFEFKLLKTKYNLKKSQLFYLPFILDSILIEELEKYPSFSERKNFISIGNFKHKPNSDAVMYLKTVIWPLIRKQLPKAELHIYGAYCTQKFEQLTNKKDGFYVNGFVENVTDVFINTRVLLAPLRYGAGLKGKLINSMEFGTPNVTTKIGAEGMYSNQKWNGFIENDPLLFAKAAVKLYTNQKLWESFQVNGIEILNTRYSKSNFENTFFTNLNKISSNLKRHRNKNLVGSILTHHTLQSTKYLSKWIEAKNG